MGRPHIARRADAANGDLPPGHLEDRLDHVPAFLLLRRRLRDTIEDENVLWGERTVDHLLAMGVADSARELRQEVELPVDAEPVTVRGKVVIETDGAFLVVKDERRTEFVLLVVAHRQDARVVEALENLELPRRGPSKPSPVVLRSRLRDEVLPDA